LYYFYNFVRTVLHYFFHPSICLLQFISLPNK
jgi:hypothetical protein